MYQSPYNPNYIIPDLYKYQCSNRGCEKQFILSEAYDNFNVKCPYCDCPIVEAIVGMTDPGQLGDLGCMAISVDQEWLRKKRGD